MISRTLAVSTGLTRHQISAAKRAGWLSEPVPGVLTLAGHPQTWHQRLAIASTAGGDRAVVSHRAAAALHTLIGGRDTVVEVTMPATAPTAVA